MSADSISLSPEVALVLPADSPARLIISSPLFAPDGHSLVDLFHAGEQRARTSQAYVRSAVGSRLRVTSHSVDGGTAEVRQVDEQTGLEVLSTIRVRGCAASLHHVVTNSGGADVTVTAVTTLGFTIDAARVDDARLLWAESQWLAENRWRDESLRSRLPDVNVPLHGQDARGRFAITSHGSWSTGEFLPVAAVVAGDDAVAWQLEASSAWHWELSESSAGATVVATGPTELEHGFAQRLAPGEHLTTEPGTVAWSDRGLDGVFGELTRLRRADHAASGDLPVVYNDFMNTLMGDPTTEKLLPLINAAAEVGAEYFCIDAGWFAHDSTWWDAVGDWTEAPSRFTGGLIELADHIPARGMVVGLWLEPEVIGVRSPVADTLPADAFFQRHGERVREDGRFHLDFRHPAVVAHLDAVVDRLVEEYGVGYFKLDYNINPGAGTEVGATSAAEGLLGHVRAYRDWLANVQARHPSLLIENCASGGMRADPALAAITNLVSTSDQQDFRLYPPIAVSAPTLLAPERAANWAYPSAAMSLEETAFSLVAGVMGRLYLSGFLHELDARQHDLVREAVALHKSVRDRIASSEPAWPLGLPGWDDTALALRLNSPDGDLVAVWSREHDGEIALPLTGTLEQIFPAAGGAWGIQYENGGVRLSPTPGFSARVFAVS